jgi:hypothetical protein
MIQKVNAPVSVISSYNHHLRTFSPRKILWSGREYYVSKIGLHHTFRQGRTLFHVFSVTGSSSFFRLVLNTDNLSWNLEEISDGQTN